ncbi:hypothetical protein EMIT036CA2_30528 [Chryseobacterium sp. IT-36CA2]
MAVKNFIILLKMIKFVILKNVS